MKKIFSIFLSVIFLATAMGTTINSHFCGMKAETSISLVQHDCCCNKGAMPKGCCKNEAKYIKITDDYSPASQFHVEKTDITPIVLNTVYVFSFTQTPVASLFSDHSPPPKFADRVIAFRSILV